MAIKSRGWTSRLPVKICCFILIPVMAFVAMLGLLQLARMNLGYVDEGFLFTDFNDSDYFYDQNMHNAQTNLLKVFGYQSEENIKAMGCLKWGRSDYTEAGEPWMELTSTTYTDRPKKWGHAKYSDIESSEAVKMKNSAIRSQLNDYFMAKEWLETMGGLYYYITDGERVLTNIADNAADFCRTQPVYLVETDYGNKSEQSRGDTYARYYGYNEDVNYKDMYIAFSQEAVNYQNAAWRGSQRAVAANIALITGVAVVALAALIILMAGAGRRRNNSGEAVHFTVLDKPWLDFGLWVLLGLEIAFCAFIYYSANVAWRYGNIRAVILLFALFSVGLTLPVLGWVLSFVKRCKAGKWWRHTMFYWVWSKCAGFVKSLWAGFPLTAKAIGASFAILCAMGMCAIAEPEAAAPMGGLFSIIIALFLLRYVKKLRLVERGAKAASVGIYDTIPVTGGELGSIADSINSISGGINTAVAERMKSERLKTELITNVSHDIRTPLTSLITYTDLLKNEGLNSERAPEYLEVLIQKSARLKTLTDDLFEASKAASGNIEVHLDTLDLSDFVRQVLGELDEKVIESGLDFRMNLPEHAPVSADGKLMWRVMDNLISNAFKYSLKGSRVYIDVTPENGGYRLDVKNISENPLNVDPAELTERFKRGDGARAGEGSGLGLSIAQSFVQAQGGRFGLAIDGDLFKATVYLPKPQA